MTGQDIIDFIVDHRYQDRSVIIQKDNGSVIWDPMIDLIAAIKDDGSLIEYIRIYEEQNYMTIQDIAKMLDGNDYPTINRVVLNLAKENGIVVCYGSSDDLIELDGAIRDEDGCFDGGVVYLNQSGFVKEESEATHKIKVFWWGDCDGERKDYHATWEYETDIPHDTFRVYEDDNVYCIGMVFYLEDLK